MSTKTPTLNSYTLPEVDVGEFPRAYTDAPDEFYETLYSECERLATALVEHLPVTSTVNGHMLNFGKARFTEYENAIASDPEVVLQGLVSACHMTERIVREHIGIENLYQYCNEEKTIRGEDAIYAFISRGCLEYLTKDTPLETVLFLYFRSQERTRIQHARGAFYKDVHEVLEENNFAVKRDGSLPGRPNIVINKEGPAELKGNAVAGKALLAKMNDIPKRARHGASCCGNIKEDTPGATCVLVFNLRDGEFGNSRIREKYRQKALNQNTDAIDAVFFQDELDEFIEFCDDQIKVFGESNTEPNPREETNRTLESW